MDKRVSIVIPTYNRAQYLPKAIDSALAQTYNCEIIVSDHGSTDGTPELMKAYEGKVKYIRREVDHGVHFCWLDGIINASGEYIHMNFDDDWIAPTFIEETIKFFDDNVAFVFSIAEIVIENEDKENSFDFKNFAKDGIHKSKRMENYLLRSGTLISPGCCLHRKSDLLDSLFVGNIPGAKNIFKGVGCDLLFCLAPLLKYPNYGFVNKPLAFLRAHDSSITISAKNDIEKKKLIKNAYNDAKKFYIKMKLLRNPNLMSLLFWIQNNVVTLPNKLFTKIRKNLEKKF